jgi:hypothetical protein
MKYTLYKYFKNLEDAKVEIVHLRSFFFIKSEHYEDAGDETIYVEMEIENAKNNWSFLSSKAFFPWMNEELDDKETSEKPEKSQKTKENIAKASPVEKKVEKPLAEKGVPAIVKEPAQMIPASQTTIVTSQPAEKPMKPLRRKK